MSKRFKKYLVGILFTIQPPDLGIAIRSCKFPSVRIRAKTGPQNSFRCYS